VAENTAKGVTGDTTSTPTDASFTFTARYGASYKYSSSFYYDETYSSTWSTHGATTITCNFVASGAQQECVAFGISGTDEAFDANGAIPCENSGTGTPSTCSVSTNTAADMILGCWGSNAGPLPSLTLGSGFSNITKAFGTGSSVACEYKIVSSTQASLGVGYSWTGSTQAWGQLADAVVINYAYTFTLSPTVSATPAVQNNIALKPSATVTATPSIQNQVVHKPSATVTATPSVSNNIVHSLAATVTATVSVAMSVVHYLAATITVTPSISCTFNALICGAVQYVFNLGVTVTISPVVACVYNLGSCGGTILNIATSSNILWILLIPLALTAFMVLRKKL
jgi:hypothetical protein